MTYLEDRDRLCEEGDSGTDGSAPEEDRGLVVLQSLGGDGSETLEVREGVSVRSGKRRVEVWKLEKMRTASVWESNGSVPRR